MNSTSWKRQYEAECCAKLKLEGEVGQYRRALKALLDDGSVVAKQRAYALLNHDVECTCHTEPSENAGLVIIQCSKCAGYPLA